MADTRKLWFEMGVRDEVASALAKNIKTAEKLHDNLPQEERAALGVALFILKYFVFVVKRLFLQR